MKHELHLNKAIVKKKNKVLYMIVLWTPKGLHQYMCSNIFK